MRGKCITLLSAVSLILCTQGYPSEAPPPPGTPEGRAVASGESLAAKSGPAAPQSTPKQAGQAARKDPSAPLVAGPSAAPVLVSGVSIVPGENDAVSVDVSTSRQPTYHVHQYKNPARLVVDFEDARNAARRQTYPAQSSLLRDVRIAQFKSENPAVVRVVADLAGDPTFMVHAQPGGVRIELSPRGAAREIPSTLKNNPKSPAQIGTAQKSASVAPAQGTLAIPIRPVVRAEVKNEAGTNSAVARASAPPGAVPPTTQSTGRLNMASALPTADAPKEASAAPRPEPPAATPEVLQAEKAARILSGSETPGVTLQGQAAARTPTSGEAKYTGEPISLNLKDVDLKDFFRLIHEISGLNIIVDPNVSGSVTLVLDTVPWDQALDIVLKNNRLGKTLEGNVLRIARVDTLTAEQEANRKLLTAREEAMPLVTVFRPVNYAKATSLQALIKSWAGGGALSKRGTILVDDRTNTLIISDIQSQIPIIESIISKLDRKARQVQIDARIIRANADFLREISGNLQIGHVNKSGSTVQTGAVGTKSTVTQNLDTPRPVLVTPETATGYGIYGISNVGANYILNALIEATENKSQTKIVSAPTIVTQNNVPGKVIQGTQIPIQTTINNTISIQYIQASLQLTVTPQVTEDGNVFMIIDVQNASPGAVLTQAGPSINTQQATTQVMVPDGGTVVFGGVNVTQRSKTYTAVPFLGTIPILGHLFKTDQTIDSDQQLLFFVSPKVLPG
ncbi:MAG TPA: type IV pilus secretin PilQ [Terriglobia bacterium]|nr:type IV pilus secretin PilQ [Terriglobia bacterium]